MENLKARCFTFERTSHFVLGVGGGGLPSNLPKIVDPPHPDTVKDSQFWKI
jgi:hypothetical protein